MPNILQIEIAFADSVKENVINKITAIIVYNGDKKTCLKLEVSDTLDLNCRHFGRWTWRKLWEALTGILLVVTERAI